MTTMEDLTDRAKALADARADLGRMVQALNAGLEALKANAMPEIRAAIDTAGAAWSHLEAGIKANPGLFIRPRTVAAHGITFGVEKGKGKLEMPDDKRTVALIKKHLPDEAAVLIKTTEKPVKKALGNLPAATLRRIGCELQDAGDAVVIRPAPSDVDKLVKALVTAEVADGADDDGEAA